MSRTLKARCVHKDLILLITRNISLFKACTSKTEMLPAAIVTEYVLNALLNKCVTRTVLLSRCRINESTHLI